MLGFLLSAPVDPSAWFVGVGGRPDMVLTAPVLALSWLPQLSTLLLHSVPGSPVGPSAFLPFLQDSVLGIATWE